MSTTYRIQTTNGDYDIEVDDTAQPEQQAAPPPPTLLDRMGDSINKTMAFINDPMGMNSKPQGKWGHLPGDELSVGPNYVPMNVNDASNSLFDKMGEATTESEVRHGMPVPIAALQGTAVSLANPLNWITPKPEPSTGRAFEPNIPKERLPGVQAAREAQVPLSRGEQTGGRFITGLENFTEKTPMGEIPMGKMRAEGDAAMQAYKERLQESMGTPKEKFDVGYEAKPAMDARASAMNKTRDAMFKAIPDDVHIPLTEYQKMGDTIVQEQSQVRPLARDADVSTFADDAQRSYGSTGEGVTGGPDVHGVTTQLPDKFIPGKNRVTEVPIEQNAPTTPYRVEDGKVIGGGQEPSYYKVKKTPDKTIPGGVEYGAEYSVGPEDKFDKKSNYADVKALRETLNGKINEAENAKNYAKARQFLRLKQALDKDITQFANAPASPLDSLTATEFKKTYGKANAFSGAYKNLFKGELADKVANAPPEKILDMVFQKNNETAIKEFHALVGDEAFQSAKRKWANDLLESPNVSKALSDKKIDPGTLRAILSGPEQEALSKYGSVQDIRKTGENFKGAHSTSRMIGHSMSYAAILEAINMLAHGDFAGAGTMAASFVGPYGVGKALTSDAIRNGVNVSRPIMKASDAVLRAYISRIRMKGDQQ